MRTEELIAELTAGLKPVPRMATPGRQAALWLGLAAAAIGIAVLLEGFRYDIGERVRLPQEVAQWLASLATAAAAALAAAMLARPDRAWRWVLLPLPPLVLWLGSLGWGCMADLERLGPMAGQLGTSWGCLGFILGLGIPLAAAQFWLLRHAGPVRPAPVLLLGGLASAALCSAGLSLFHHLDAAVMILLWHGGAMALLMLLGWLLGRRFMRRRIIR